jgi:hypothetical protein
MEELWLTVRFFVMVAAGYTVAAHLAADSVYGWLGVHLPDPAGWLLAVFWSPLCPCATR